MEENSQKDRVKLIINGAWVRYDDIHDYFGHLLLLLDVKYSPVEVLKENMVKIRDIFLDFCQYRREEVNGRDKAAITRFVKWVDGMVDRWGRYSTRNQFMQDYYDTLLFVQGLSPLHGFGIEK
jgi:hypothetical protein